MNRQLATANRRLVARTATLNSLIGQLDLVECQRESLDALERAKVAAPRLVQLGAEEIARPAARLQGAVP